MNIINYAAGSLGNLLFSNEIRIRKLDESFLHKMLLNFCNFFKINIYPKKTSVEFDAYLIQVSAILSIWENNSPKVCHCLFHFDNQYMFIKHIAYIAVVPPHLQMTSLSGKSEALEISMNMSQYCVLWL